MFKNRWITPNEFQAISGRKSSKDWKRSIRLKGRCLKEFIAQGLFQEHAKTCACKICCGDDVEMLKQEGEMALAAKRRRLSQADSHMSAGETFGMQTAKTTHVPDVEEPVESQPPPSKSTNSRKRRMSQDDVMEIDESLPRQQKIWSPSGGISDN